MLKIAKTRLQRVTLLCCALYSVIFVLMLIFRPGSKHFYHAWNNIYQIIPPFFAGACGVLFARAQKHLPKTQRMGALCLGLGGFSFALGQATWTYYETFRNIDVPFPGWADAGYLGAYPFLIAGTLLLFSSTHIAGRARMLLDSVIAASGVGMLSWYFLVQRLWQKSDVSRLGKIISIGYPLGDVAILCGALILLNSVSANRSRRRSSILLILGMALIAFFDTTFTYYSLNNTYETGSWFDWSLSFGWLLIGLSALAQAWSAQEAEAAQSPTLTSVKTSRSIVRVLTPYAAAGSAFLIVAYHDYLSDHIISPSTFAAGLGLILLVVIRQVFTLVENQFLTHQLRGLTENLEQIVARRTQQLTALHQLTTAVNNTLQVDQVLSVAAQHTRQALHANAIALWLLEPASASGEKSSQIYLHEGLSDEQDIFQFVNDLPMRDQVEVFPLPSNPKSENRMQGYFLRAPLRWQKRPMGSIGVIRWTDAFSPTDAELLESIGFEIGAALENARMYGEAVEAADRDPVTGLFNHRAIHQRLDRAFMRADEKGEPLTVIMMDMNNFKLFNDTYGHPTGDQVLKTVARTLTEVCRKQDILGRYGGDEFIVVLPQTDAKAAIGVAERLRERMIRNGFRKPGEERVIPITLSFGIATFPEDGNNRHELLTNADANLYAAKQTEVGIMGTSDSQRANRELRAENSFGVLEAMVTAVDNKDRYTRRHSEDVTEYALWIAEELGLSEETMRIIRIGGLLHDVGKISVPDDILRKPGHLTPEEYEIMQRHPHIGSLIVGAIPGMECILDAVRSHHERFDGKGYPDALAGEDIPLLGRIMAVADAFSAMTTDRPYRKGLNWEVALAEIEANIGSQFDPTMARAFLRAADKRRAQYESTTPAELESLPKAA